MQKVLRKMEDWFMTEKIKIESLISEVEKTKSLLEKIENHYAKFKENEFKKLGETQNSAIILSEIFVNYYTCLETLFLKISQHFENDLSSKKWHKDLLHKMTLEIPNIRKSVISDQTCNILQEFLRFRHFKRYYFELEYDCDKLKFLEKKFKQLKPNLYEDVNNYLIFLKGL